MEIFDKENRLQYNLFDYQAIEIVVEAMTLATNFETRSGRCKTGHLLLSLLKKIFLSSEYCEALEQAIKEGSWNELSCIIKAYVKDTKWERTLRGCRDDFSDELVKVFESCDTPVTEKGLWISLMSNPGHEELENFKDILDFEKAANAFKEMDTWEKKLSVVEIFSPEGSLNFEYFDDSIIPVIEIACERAGGLGYEKIYSPHLFLALLEKSDSITEEVIRIQAGPGIGPRNIAEALIHNLTLGPGVKTRQWILNKYSISENLQDIFKKAYILAKKNKSETIEERFLLRALIQAERDSLIGKCLSSKEFEFNLDFLIRDIDRRIRYFKLGKPGENIIPFFIPREIAKSEDLTYLGRTGQISPGIGQEELVKQILQGLHKKQNNNILITGHSGVGKTKLVYELARQIGEDKIPFLKRKKIVWVDCESISPGESRQSFQKIVTAIKGRNNIILCLDHFENILQYAGNNENNNRNMVKVTLRNHDIHLIAIIEDRYYIELLSNDYSFLELFTRIEVTEVTAEKTIEIIQGSFAKKLEQIYALRIEEKAIKRAATASKEFIMSERLPIKATKILQEACEYVCYNREMKPDTEPLVKEEQVIKAVSARTGIDESTIAGTGSDIDFYKLLSKDVVGQEHAVKAVAMQLERIKAGATREGKPAGVFFFAGLTGTGKTELAKSIARVYSASGKLSIYPMTNFTEHHSVSGITGVPPGYVGYSAGGRLINDLNADPYGVILFDEAEKAHQDIWQAMLSLFDEAWIEDRRNVKAYGNRAIFILTSNAGADIIMNMLKKNYPIDEIKKEVGKCLVEHRNQKGERVFSPEFLGRFNEIVIFNPLSLEAMEAIAHIHINRIIKEWASKRNKKLIIQDNLIKYIAKVSYEEEGGTKGGRFVAKKIADFIEMPAIQIMKNQRHEFDNASSLELFLQNGHVSHKLSCQE